MISVITVTFNAADTLEETLKSLDRQTYRDFEVVAIDGGSKDGTVDVFKKYDHLVGTLISEPDKGVYDAMNKGVKAAKGEILFFLNAQDTLYSDDVFEKIVEAFSTAKRPYVVFGDVFFTNRQNLPPSELTLPPNTVRSFKDSGPNEPGICHQCLFYRRELFERLGAYDLKYRIYGDFDFNIRVFDFAGDRYQYVPVVISNFDLGGLSTRTNSKYIQLMHQENMELRQKYETMKRKTRVRRFLFSHGHQMCDGGYYVQFLGVRLDWTAWKCLFGLLPQTLPLEYDFALGLPDGVTFGGMENVLNGVSWFRGDTASVVLSLADVAMLSEVELRVRVIVSVRARGEAWLHFRVNGHAIASEDFSSYCCGEQRDIKFSARIPTDVLRKGKNIIELVSDHDKRADLTFGLQGFSIGKPLPLPIVRSGQELSFAAAGMSRMPVVAHGLYSPEDWGAWLHARANLTMRLPAGETDLELDTEWRVFVLSPSDKRQVAVVANGTPVADLEFTGMDGFPARRTIKIARKVIGKNGELRLEIVCKNPVVPAEVDPKLGDTRVLSVALSKIVVREVCRG